MHALYYQRDGHPAVPVLLGSSPVADATVQFGYLIIDGDEKDRYETVQKYIKEKGLGNVPGRFLLVRLEEIEVEIISQAPDVEVKPSS